MTWRCVPVACYHKAPHIAAAAFGVLVAAHPQPAGVAACKCKMVWYPDAPAAQPLDVPAPSPIQRFDRMPPSQVIAPGPRIVSAPWEDVPAPPLVVQQQPTPVPEPATWTILAVVLAVLASLRASRFFENPEPEQSGLTVGRGLDSANVSEGVTGDGENVAEDAAREIGGHAVPTVDDPVVSTHSEIR